jgi:hypothetical protein
MSFGAAFKAFFTILGNSEKAAQWEKSQTGNLIEENELKSAKDQQVALERQLKNSEAATDAVQKELTQLKSASKNDRSDAVYTLTLLQREGRLIDFLKEDVSSFSDEQVGAAVRQIHEGCGKVLERYFKVEALASVSEGESLTVPKGFDPSEYQMSGQVAGEAPYTGNLVHKGWKASALSLPERSSSLNGMVICPAEVEV